MWKDSIRNNVVIFQTTILRIVGFYVRHSATILETKFACCPIYLKIIFWSSQAHANSARCTSYVVGGFRQKSKKVWSLAGIQTHIIRGMEFICQKLYH